ncbi:MAG: VOC family protein [Candidatus Binatia bacterium]
MARRRASDGGQEVQCGWLKDKYGLSWQIVPTILSEMVTDSDPKKAESDAGNATNEKIDIKARKQAYEQE